MAVRTNLPALTPVKVVITGAPTPGGSIIEKTYYTEVATPANTWTITRVDGRIIDVQSGDKTA
ncbi:hypothetical protein [Paractinoplanes durhamensis]|uniref:Uncharacterized protein n=1 Tax=Paractinoplanes durhamensis TaxID=113563 RepID=A0ABQ3ZBU1_9ACTN|nr:hypothetical protein [Actinoplanes durhamensis]GIE07300.1 hypothetical protein Adu01nite_86500 [Actinoplanes durhamensis]